MEKPVVLVCPMDWGLGHASRCVPVIRAFIRAGCKVVAACSGPGAGLIRREFGITHQGSMPPAGKPFDGNDSTENRPVVIPFPGFPVSYSRRALFFNLVLRMPLFLYHIGRERRMLRSIVERTGADLIVSDNRYGLVHRSVPSVLITHQLRPVMPVLPGVLGGPAGMMVRKMVRAFDECWIPDCPTDTAAGELIRGWEKLPAVHFVGWLSRFSDAAPSRTAEPSGYRIMFILSGPEPRRTMLEDLIIDRMKDYPVRLLLVQGLPSGSPEGRQKGSVGVVPFLDSAGMKEAVMKSDMVVCRSGYSTVMDMLVLGKRAVLIPTPGQTEQEYLGRWLSEKGWFRVVSEKDFDPDILTQLYNDMSLAGDRRAGKDNGFARACPGENDMLGERVEVIVKKLHRKGVKLRKRRS